MDSRSFSGGSLEKALQEGVLTQSETVLTGVVKSSEKSGYVSFSQSGCGTWVDLPIDMIQQADHIGQRPCQGHSHPVMRITLKEPSDSQGRTLLALLAQAATNPSAEMPFDSSFRSPQFQGEGSLAPESAQGSSYLIFCRPRCVEWSRLFPNICNRWVYDCWPGPIIFLPPIGATRF